jgi:hypothetical protein
MDFDATVYSDVAEDLAHGGVRNLIDALAVLDP